MSFNFPNTPTVGQEYTPVGGPVFTWDGTTWKALVQGSPVTVHVSDTAPTNPAFGQLWWDSDTGNLFIWYADGNSAQWVQVSGSVAAQPTALTKNRVVNGAMQISQELGDVAVATGASGGGYPVDQWQASWGLTGTANAYRARPSSSGSDYVVMNVVTATASPAAGAYFQLIQDIEGIRVKDFLWGTAVAKQAILRFSCFTNAAGTYTAAIRNGASDRCFLAPFTVAANQWTSISIVVPGDTTGTWPVTTAKGMSINFGLASGTTYGGGTTGWGTSNKIQIAGNTNLAAMAGNVFLVTDVGLYLDPDKTGVPPKWEMPDEAEELRACQRYWQKVEHDQTAFSTAAGTSYNSTSMLPVVMRTAPALANIVVGTPAGGANASGTYATATKLVNSLTTSSVGVTFTIVGRVNALNARM